MNKLYVKVFLFVYSLNFVYIVSSTPLQENYNPEINDQFENTTEAYNNQNENATIETIFKHYNSNVIEDSETTGRELVNRRIEDKMNLSKSNNVIAEICQIIKTVYNKILSSPKIMSVLRNVATCIVNGVMEIISYYLPAPLIPLIATIAGKVIPFEPVVTLRRRMPVTSYRRAIKTAVDGFLNTFNDYKFDNYDEDPYMTRRFNRRFMNNLKDGDKNDLK